MRQYIAELGEKVLSGGQITYEEALALEKTSGADISFLVAYAAKIREVFHGNRVDLCSIISVRTGKCGEDCAFCSQSSHHNTGLESSVNLDEENILARAKEVEAAGVHRFDLVASGIGYTFEEAEFQMILQIFRRLKKDTKLQLCACLGVIGEPEAVALKEVGVTRYNHNLETAESYFPQITTTHSYKTRERTVLAVRRAGMQVCCGGVVGMGESFAQRVELAVALRELDVDSVPINVLNPLPGTPLAEKKLLGPLESVKTMAMFRMVLPRPTIRFAGGREANLRSLQALGLSAGINGMLTGNYLTTKGQGIAADLTMLEDAGLEW